MTTKTTFLETEPDVTQTKLSGRRDSVPSAGRFPERLCFPRVVAGFTLVIGLVFCWLSHRPLWHTDVWEADGHNFGLYALNKMNGMSKQGDRNATEGIPHSLYFRTHSNMSCRQSRVCETHLIQE